MKQILITALFLLVSFNVSADDLSAQEYQRTPQQFHPDHRQSQSAFNDAPDQIVQMFLSNGPVGAMLLLMCFWFYKTENLARQDRNKMNDKFEELIRESFDKSDLIEVKTSIASINTQMANVEREVETLKDFVLSGRVGGKA